jgi:tetratricopeptide (TPR) repeat protein
MYLQTSKYRLQRKKPRRVNLALIFLLIGLILAAVYLQANIGDMIEPMFVPTPTPTRPAASYANDAAAMFVEGKLNSAMEMYRQAILLAPTNSDLYVALSRVQVFAHDYAGAVENAQYAVLLSKSAISYAVWGEALYRQEREKALPAYEAAAKQLRKSLELDPSLALAHAYLAEVLIDTDWQYFDEAKEEARTAVTLAPDLMESHRARGFVYLMTGNYVEALDEYQKAIELHGKLRDLWIALGDCYDAVDDPAEAVQAYVNATTYDSSDPIPFTRLARLYAGEGEFGKAEQNAEMAVTLLPQNPSYHGLWGVMLYRNHKNDQAILELSLAITGGRVDDIVVEGLPLSPFPVSEYYWTYGLALAKAGRCPEAIPVFRLLEQQMPDDEIVIANVTEGLRICKEIPPGPAE